MFLKSNMLFLFWKLIGLAPVKLCKNENGINKLKLSKFGLTCSIIILLIYIICGSYSFYFIILNNSNVSNNNLSTITTAVSLDMITLMLTGFIIVIHSKWQCYELYNLNIYIYYNIDKKLNKYYFNKKIAYFTIIWLLYITILILIDRLVSHISNSIVYFLPFLMSYYHLTSLCLQFIEVVLNINERFKIINNNFNYILNNNNNYYYTVKYRKLNFISRIPTVKKVLPGMINKLLAIYISCYIHILKFLKINSKCYGYVTRMFDNMQS